MRGKVSMEGGEDSKKKRGAKRASTTQSIVINELPYQICKVRFLCARCIVHRVFNTAWVDICLRKGNCSFINCHKGSRSTHRGIL